MPIRIQRKRTKGWKMPPNTRCVTRPGPFGNPFATAHEFRAAMMFCHDHRCVPWWMDAEKGQRVLWMLEHLHELAGLNLACFCGLDADCHADVLLEFANTERLQ